MASIDDVFTRVRESVSDIADRFIGESEAIARKAASGVTNLLNQKANDKNIALTTSEVRRVLKDSGVNKQITDLLGEGYQKIATDTIGAYKELINPDLVFNDEQLANLSRLQQIDGESFEEILNNATSEISRSIKGVQTGTSTIDAALLNIDKTITNRLVNNMQTNIDTATSAFHQNITITLAEDVGLNQFKYIGPLDGRTRPFCRRSDVINQIKTLAEWDKLDNGQINPVSAFRGGYRCRHQLTPVIQGV